MEFKIKYAFPVIILILGIASIFFLTKIDPFNLVIAAVIFVIAAIMVWRIYYDFSSAVPAKTEVEYAPSGNVSELIKESPKEAESKMKLDDFLKSSPKNLSLGKEEKNVFSSDFTSDLEYKKMKAEALKELKGVIKPTEPKAPVAKPAAAPKPAAKKSVLKKK